jgi:hypothetical protein
VNCEFDVDREAVLRGNATGKMETEEYLPAAQPGKPENPPESIDFIKGLLPGGAHQGRFDFLNDMQPVTMSDIPKVCNIIYGTRTHTIFYEVCRLNSGGKVSIHSI